MATRETAKLRWGKRILDEAKATAKDIMGAASRIDRDEEEPKVIWVTIAHGWMPAEHYMVAAHDAVLVLRGAVALVDHMEKES